MNETGNKQSVKKPRDPDLVGAEAAMHRAAKRARQRAIETTGSVLIFKDGKIVRTDWIGTYTKPDSNI